MSSSTRSLMSGLRRELQCEEIDLLRERGVQIVSRRRKRLDDVEVARCGGAPRDKIVDVEAMLAVLARR